MKVELYTDGGCSGNPGIGGYAYVIRVVNGDICASFVRSGFKEHTTNNHMELKAIVEGLKEISNSPACNLDIEIISDSSYCVNAFKENWIVNWRRNNFKKKGSPIPNRDLWLELDNLLGKVGKVTWTWIKGHNGHKFNEICDTYAVRSYRERESYFDKIEVRE